MTNTPYRTRIAPSPTGFLHLGHAFSALTAFEAALKNGGEFILRIEDIDHTRCRPDYEVAIFEDLAWLGLDWPKPVLRQSEHLADYQKALDQLWDLGVLYEDARTRQQQVIEALGAPQEGEASGDKTKTSALKLSLKACRDLLGAQYDKLGFEENGHRIKADPAINGDVVLGRKDIGVAYHLCVVIDDARQNITHIHRGRDLFDATHTQVLLQTLLGLPTPKYAHHALVLDDQGRRLAKRKGSKSLRDYRREGSILEDILSKIMSGLEK